MSDNKIKIQHYVPRFYLKNFSVEQKKNHLINCYDKSTKKIFFTNIENIGCENYFYDIEEDVNQTIEKHLGEWESKFSKSYEKLLSVLDVNKLDNSDKEIISYFIAAQLARTRENRIQSKDLVKQLKKRIYKDATTELKKQIDEASSDKSIKERHIAFIIKTVPLFVDIISKMKWVLFINKTKKPFWTSDNPVTLHNDLKFDPFGNLGLLCKGIQLHFPLNPKIVLLTLDPNEYAYFPDSADVIDEQNVIFENHLQVKRSTMHLFSIDDDFELAETMIKEHPEIGNIDRKRWELN
jgi:hypothetical protein